MLSPFPFLKHGTDRRGTLHLLLSLMCQCTLVLEVLDYILFHASEDVWIQCPPRYGRIRVDKLSSRRNEDLTGYSGAEIEILLRHIRSVPKPSI